MLNWLSKGQKSQLPQPTSLQVLRAKQIEQLRLLGYVVSEIQRDAEYRVIVTDAVSLHVMLPPQFPQERPILRVSPGVIHPWVNDQMLVTGCSAVMCFRAHSDLGKVVKEVVEELRRNPLTLAASPPQYSVQGNGLLDATKSGSKQVAASSIRPGNFDSSLPDFSHILKDLTIEEISSLMDNEEKILTCLEPFTQTLVCDRAGAMQALEVSARENIAKQLQLEEKKRTVLEKHETLNILRHKLDGLLHLQDTRQEKYELCLIQDNLKVASLESDEKAEAFAEKFLHGQISVEEFRKNYMVARVHYHQRRAMEDKMAQLVSRQQSNYK